MEMVDQQNVQTEGDGRGGTTHTEEGMSDIKGERRRRSYEMAIRLGCLVISLFLCTQGDGCDPIILGNYICIYLKEFRVHTDGPLRLIFLGSAWNKISDIFWNLLRDRKGYESIMFFCRTQSRGIKDKENKLITYFTVCQGRKK
ncbi:hypothetical protein L1987_30769 [Smallanthus sonchifolius]|uniref:Uncharacterized protein n=1 Tax=Smallanthus sonchifolius TaxID=185202 RepID=A0ACB9I340_9ASTR|nr:hypothetical protein L1987_30769 [Smallanthus sonchifolius]